MIREYADDEANSETTTRLQMFVGGAGQATSSGRAIHWHADPSIDVEYIAADQSRQVIPYVKLTDGQGRVREYQTEGTTPESLAQGQRRVMDCIDCHNAVAHRISPTAERAVDVAMAAVGSIDGFRSCGGKGLASSPRTTRAGTPRCRRSTASCGRSIPAAAASTSVPRTDNRHRPARCTDGTSFPR